MSILNRRKFLTGSLFAAGAAIAMQASDIVAGNPDRNEKQMGLENYLHDRHPEIQRDIIQGIARRYADYERSPMRPALAGAGAGLAYAYFSDGREHGAGDKAIAVLGGDGLLSALFLMGAKPVAEPDEIKVEISDLTKLLTEDQQQGLANSVYDYLRRHVVGTPVAPAIAVTALSRDMVEKQLDKHDVNLPSQG